MSNALVQKLFQAVDSRDWSSLAEVFAPEVIYERPGYPAFVGLDHLLRFYSEERVVAEGRHELVSVIVEDDQCACWGRFVGTHRDGSDIDVSFADFYTFANGRIRTRRSFFFRPAI